MIPAALEDGEPISLGPLHIVGVREGAASERKAIVAYLRHMAGSWERNGDANHENDARLLRTAGDHVESGKHLDVEPFCVACGGVCTF